MPHTWIPQYTLTAGRRCAEIVPAPPSDDVKLSFMDYTSPAFFAVPPTQLPLPLTPSSERLASMAEAVPGDGALQDSMTEVSLGSIMSSPLQDPFADPESSPPMPIAQNSSEMSLPWAAAVAPTRRLGLSTLSIHTPGVPPTDVQEFQSPSDQSTSDDDVSFEICTWNRSPAVLAQPEDQPSETASEGSPTLAVPTGSTTDHPMSPAVNPQLRPSYLLSGIRLSSGLPSTSSLSHSSSFESVDLGGSSLASSEPSPLTTPDLSSMSSPISPSASTTSLTRSHRPLWDVVGAVWTRLIARRRSP